MVVTAVLPGPLCRSALSCIEPAKVVWDFYHPSRWSHDHNTQHDHNAQYDHMITTHMHIWPHDINTQHEHMTTSHTMTTWSCDMIATWPHYRNMATLSQYTTWLHDLNTHHMNTTCMHDHMIKLNMITTQHHNTTWPHDYNIHIHTHILATAVIFVVASTSQEPLEEFSQLYIKQKHSEQSKYPKWLSPHLYYYHVLLHDSSGMTTDYKRWDRGQCCN